MLDAHFNPDADQLDESLEETNKRYLELTKEMLKRLGNPMVLNPPLATHEVFSIMKTVGYKIGNPELHYMLRKGIIQTPEKNKYGKLAWSISNLKSLHQGCEKLKYWQPMPNPLHDMKKDPKTLAKESANMLMGLEETQLVEVVKNTSTLALLLIYENCPERFQAEKEFLKHLTDMKHAQMVQLVTESN